MDQSISCKDGISYPQFPFYSIRSVLVFNSFMPFCSTFPWHFRFDFVRFFHPLMFYSLLMDQQCSRRHIKVGTKVRSLYPLCLFVFLFGYPQQNSSLTSMYVCMYKIKDHINALLESHLNTKKVSVPPNTCSRPHPPLSLPPTNFITSIINGTEYYYLLLDNDSSESNNTRRLGGPLNLRINKPLSSS